MSIVVITIVVFILAICIYLFIHYEITKHATLIVRKQAQDVTDDAVKACLPILVQSDLLQDKESQFDESETVADVWGRGVMAFEYVFKVQDVVSDDLASIKGLLTQELATYAVNAQIEKAAQAPQAFVVTDAWLYKQTLHLDIAYLMNEATFEYVHDLKKLK